MGGQGFRKLIVWQKAKDLSVMVYKLTGNGILSRDFGLRDQIRRSAVSIASNIASGENDRKIDQNPKSPLVFFISSSRP